MEGLEVVHQIVNHMMQHLISKWFNNPVKVIYLINSEIEWKTNKSYLYKNNKK